MTIPRFYISPDRWDPDHLALDEAESHHCTEVLRLREGDRVVVFDGRGTEVTATIAFLTRREVGLEPVSTQKTPPPRARITLAQAIPKGKNMELIVQKATELGAHAIVPLLSERVIVRLSRDERDERRAKWQRVAVEACKQCGRNHVPAVEVPVTPAEFLAAPRTEEMQLIAAIDPSAQRLQRLLAEWRALHPDRGQPQSAVIMIGPEGDFTPAEVGQALSSGFLPMSLGPVILRTETAALYSLSVLGHELF